jgi:hypothetical protein
MRKLGKVWMLRSTRSIVVYLIAAAIVIPLACVMVFIPLGFATRAKPGNNAPMILFALSTLTFLALLFGGTTAVAAWIMIRRKRWLDDAFVPLGLAGSRYILTGRRYTGTIEGKEVEVRFYRGPALEIYVDTPLHTRLGIAERSRAGSAIAGLFNREPISIDHPDLESISVFALDHPWARALLEDPQARALILEMVAGETPFMFQQVFLQPGRFCLRLYSSNNLGGVRITPQEAERWVNDLLALTATAERLPSPEQTAQPTALETAARTGTGRNTALIAGGVVLAVLGLILCPSAVIIVVLLAANP